MSDQPIVPSRIIPPGAPLPRARAFDAPPGATDLPPWRIAPPPPTPPAPPVPPAAPAPEPPREVVVRHTVELVWPEPEPEPTRWQRLWAWATSRIRPWQAALAVTGALVPIPWTSYSVATTWAATVAEARAMSVGLGYTIAATTFGLAVYRLARVPRTTTLFVTVVTFVGTFGAIDLFDPITAITGVRP